MRTLATILEERSIPEPNSGCLLWLGACHPIGHGMMGWRGKNWYVHRLAYELANGPIPKGMIVRHKCDVPACINPAHLEMGTKADNSADMARRGRQTHGMRNRHAKLTDDLVRQIRALQPNNSTAVGRMFGVTRRTIERIWRRDIWKLV